MFDELVAHRNWYQLLTKCSFSWHGGFLAIFAGIVTRFRLLMVHIQYILASMLNSRVPRFGGTAEPGGASLKDELHKDNHMPILRGPWVRTSQLPELFCSWDLAYRCTKGGWLRPIVQGKRRTIYRLADVLVCMQRIEAGELPPPRRTNPTL